MTLDRTRWCQLLVGLERVEVLDVVRLLERLLVTVESTDRLMGCGACGTRATVKDRDRVELADLPACGCPVTLVWLKGRWRCGEADGEGISTEDRPDIAPARSTMTRRAGVWATTQVGRHVHFCRGQPRSWASPGTRSWTRHAVGRGACRAPRPGRRTSAIGVDETSFPAATATEGTRWVSSICDVEGRTVIDVIEGRRVPDLDRWLTDQAEEWKAAATITVCDLHGPFRAGLAPPPS